MKALFVVVALTGTAAAEDFALLDRQDATDKLQLDASYFTLRNVGQFMRLDAFGAIHFGSFGIYGNVPLAYESDMSGSSDGGIGNLELGALFARDGFILHAGVALPTNTDDRTSSGPVNQSVTARLGDLVLALPGTTAFRAGISYEARRCAIFTRFDLGLDVLLDSEYGPQLGNEEVHLDAGIGFDAGDLEVTAEAIVEFTPDGEADPFAAVAGSIRFRASQTNQLYLAIAVPIDNTRGEQNFVALAGFAIRR